MARVSRERAPAFTSEELERLVDGILPQYPLLYGPPDKQDSGHQKKSMWLAIAKGVPILGVFDRWSTHSRKRGEDLRRWAKRMAEAQLGLATQRGRGARRTLAPLMFCILAVAYPELDERLKASRQPQGGAVLTVVVFAAVRVPGVGGGRPTLEILAVRAPWDRGSSLCVERENSNIAVRTVQINKREKRLDTARASYN
ncbi:hypothetical protein NDU88_003665 [Pleurodeles waltl]|uniref:Uncharacterized protein n=1 Tax=Pleurodeles waltl TaxID=8319 RepID=A0AAV7KVK7_PLEWA|nr:hypothetical protein NDU88_003665 [Pleurodeles waltl]